MSYFTKCAVLSENGGLQLKKKIIYPGYSSYFLMAPPSSFISWEHLCIREAKPTLVALCFWGVICLHAYVGVLPCFGNMSSVSTKINYEPLIITNITKKLRCVFLDIFLHVNITEGSNQKQKLLIRLHSMLLFA